MNRHDRRTSQQRTPRSRPLPLPVALGYHWDVANGALRTVKCLALALLIGCAAPVGEDNLIPQWRMDAALEAWVENGNPEGECRGTRPELRFVPVAELQALCQTSEEIWGCTLDGVGIVIDERANPHQRTLALEHELRHWLSYCSVYSSDYHHFRDRAWYPHPETGEEVRTAATWGVPM